MKAAVQEMRAKVVEAEAEVPKAMASALREGKLGVMDYYNMQNLIADTTMRDSIGKGGQPEQGLQGQSSGLIPEDDAEGCDVRICKLLSSSRLW